MMPTFPEDANFEDSSSSFIWGILTRFDEAQIKINLEWMSALNERRLYWVWAGGVGLLGCVINLLSNDYGLDAKNELAPLSLFGGFLSWSLYYLRFTIRLALLLQHTQVAVWLLDLDLSDEVLNAQFAEAWDEYKYSLINDFFWGHANLACFFWLTGAAASYGDMLTVALLLMDASLAIYRLWETREKYIADMQQNPDHMLDYNYNLDWSYALYSLLNDVLYAITLCLAFALVCGFFISSLSVAAALMCNVAGTVLCFSLNTFFSATQRCLDISKSVALWDHVRQDILLQHAQSSNTPDLAYFQSRLLLIEQKEQEILYQKMSLLRAVLIDVLVPPVVFMALVLMPLSVGLPLIAAGFFIAVASYGYIEDHYNAPELIQAPDVNKNTLDAMVFRLSGHTQGFFTYAADSLEQHKGLMMDDSRLSLN